ncbi:lysozyme C-2-like [Danio rerio]|uniref:Lysozyme C-2-like n=1 Tax=Danio rerio TaxID=7955 RepID=A0A8M6Z596_DANRE|nr:sperm acrosome-associated protein 5-like [Danio rerio]|eukprot:XP_017209867.1 sperm acrosome-associated protein 5-like [Danio rerio]
MKSALSVKMLCALALLLLVFRATEARIVSKCELKERLEAAQIKVIRAMGDKMTVGELISRLVCKASGTGFNTSLVETIIANSNPLNIFSTRRLVWRLYGLFQLSDQWACDSGLTPSLNVCNISCSDLIDDDVTDDIACLKTVINSIKPRPKQKPNEITLPITTLSTILMRACHFIVASEYFSECLTPTSPVITTSMINATLPVTTTSPQTATSLMNATLQGNGTTA